MTCDLFLHPSPSHRALNQHIGNEVKKGLTSLCVRSCWRREAAAAAAVQEDAAAGRAEREGTERRVSGKSAEAAACVCGSSTLFFLHSGIRCTEVMTLPDLLMNVFLFVLLQKDKKKTNLPIWSDI